MVYALVHPRTLEARYVGKSRDGARRFKRHSHAARHGHEFPVYRWWRKLLAAGDGAPCLVRLGDGDSAEEILWIADLKARGARLLNLTAGGEGTSGYRWTPAQRANMSRVLLGNTRNLGKSLPEETRRKMSETHKRIGTKPPSPVGRVVSEAARLAGARNLAAYRRTIGTLSLGIPGRS